MKTPISNLNTPTAITARAHGSYEDLAADAGVDVVYIATPSSRHVSDSLLCLEARANIF